MRKTQTRVERAYRALESEKRAYDRWEWLLTIWMRNAANPIDAMDERYCTAQAIKYNELWHESKSVARAYRAVLTELIGAQAVEKLDELLR